MPDYKEADRSLFIADLHLTEARPLTIERFFHFLRHLARGSDALYILGDLFEYWIGDDDQNNSVGQSVAVELKMLADSGTRIFFIHGNRDFLLAHRYARQSGMSLLPDPVVIDLYGTSTLISHGDRFCTDDKGYQRYRKWVRNPLLLKMLHRLPLRTRHALAKSARAESERAKAGKPQDIMDVNQKAIEQAFRQFGVTRMIHGHTHRPARHEISLAGRKHERWVLPDWYEEGGYLVCTANGCTLNRMAHEDAGKSDWVLHRQGTVPAGGDTDT